MNSPCIGLCRIDFSSGLCRGCARTAAEVAAWRDASPAYLGRVWSELPARRERTGIELHRLDWGRDEAVDFIGRSLRPGGGAWAFGNLDAAVGFRVEPGDACEPVAVGPARIEARTPRAAIRFEVPETIRVLSWASRGEDPAARPMAMAVPKPRRGSVPRPGLAALGADRDAIDPADRAGRLYDLGLPRPGFAFCLRTEDPGLIRDLDDCQGLAWPELLATIGRRIAEASPARVVVGPIGRVEAFGPIAGEDPLGSIRPPAVPPGLDDLETLVPCAFHFAVADEPAGGAS